MSMGLAPRACTETLLLLARMGYQLDWATVQRETPRSLLVLLQRIRYVSAPLNLVVDLMLLQNAASASSASAQPAAELRSEVASPSCRSGALVSRPLKRKRDVYEGEDS